MSGGIDSSTIRNVFVSVGCNREPSVLDWNHTHNLIAYGGSSLIAVYNPDSQVSAIVGTLRGHTGDINCVSWMPEVTLTDIPQDTYFLGQLVSGGFDGKVIVWDVFQKNVTEYEPSMFKASASSDKSLYYRMSVSLSPASVQSSTTDPITNVSNIRLNQHTFIAACTASGLVHIWHRHDDQLVWSNVQTLEFANAQIMQSIAFSLYRFSDGSQGVFLALAGVDCKVHIMACITMPQHDTDSPQQPFFPLGSLDGHIDWVRHLSFCSTDESNLAPLSHQTATPSVLLLASASQDKTVRLWRFSAPSVDTLKFLEKNQEEISHAHNDEEKAQLQEAANVIASSSLGEKGHLFSCGVGTHHLVSVNLESVLVGHEEWVFSFQWHPIVDGKQPLILLTASQDKTMMLWKPDTQYGSSLWVNEMRVGESGGMTLGLYGAAYGPLGQSVIGVDFSGCFHIWSKTLIVQENEATGVNTESIEWDCVVPVSGHNRPVTDIMLAYKPQQSTQSDLIMPYIVSASGDQTARVFSPWLSTKNPHVHTQPHTTKRLPTIATHPWFEIARPQVHGWDLAAIAPVPGAEHEYVSCSEEKLMRVMKAPMPFIGSLGSLTTTEGLTEDQLITMFKDNNKTISDNAGVDGDYSAMNEGNLGARALAANLPELGLSNKPIMEGDDYMAEGVRFPKKPLSLLLVPAELHTGLKQVFSEQPPIEDELISCSLWPEIEKLYGHGYDLASIAACSITPLIASASHARKAKNAAIRLWDTRTWTEVQQLTAHQSTVSQMLFSPGNRVKYSQFIKTFNTQYNVYAADNNKSSILDVSQDKFLVSVSRDQQFALWRRSSPDSSIIPLQQDPQVALPNFVLCDLQKAHTRQIYSVCWIDDGLTFVTSSRDKNIKVWRVTNPDTAPKVQCVQTIDKLPFVITALASTHTVINNQLTWVLVAGGENGLIHVYTQTVCDVTNINDANLIQPQSEWVLSCRVNDDMCHSDAVNKILFFPRCGDENLIMVSAAQDHSVRVWALDF